MKRQYKNRFQPCLDSCLTCLSHSFPLHSTKREWAFSLLGSTHYQGFFLNSFVSWVISLSLSLSPFWPAYLAACLARGQMSDRQQHRAQATSVRTLEKPGYEKIGRWTGAPTLQNRIFLRGGCICTQTRKRVMVVVVLFSLSGRLRRFPVFKQGQPWPATQLSCLWVPYCPFWTFGT